MSLDNLITLISANTKIAIMQQILVEDFYTFKRLKLKEIKTHLYDVINIIAKDNNVMLVYVK